jgi:Bifunctional DNA primase/polymerase, N-terminal
MSKEQSPTTLRKQLLAAGYAPIPVNGKVPVIEGWPEKTKTNNGEIELWAKLFSDAQNTGLLTRKMPTLDIDILNEDASEAVEELVRARFEERGNILVRIGLAPKRAIPFRTDTPFEKITANLVAPNGKTGQKLELLADGQQVVAFGIHPDTGKPYAWHGDKSRFELKELPLISEAEAQQLVDDAVKLLCEKFGYTRAGKNKSKDGNGADSEDWGPLLANIRAGHELHDSIRDLAAKLIVSGMSGGAAINLLRAAMQECTPHDARWQERFDDIPRAVETAEEKFGPIEVTPPAPAAKCSLDDVHNVFRKWLGKEYDIDAINATCAAAAAERLTGDPLWLLLVSGPGAAKTETAQAVVGAGAHVTSTIASEGALLSATPFRARSKKATGGLLRKIGERGVLVIKDFTSIISSDRNVRQAVLAAIREIYDGRWERNVGSDGGQTLTWVGRIVIIGAVTTAWDSAHQVVAACGDRFVLIRIDSNLGRQKSGSRAIDNTGSEVQMREELAAAVGGLVASACTDNVPIKDDERDRLLKAADIVTMARTAVERDYRGEVLWAHAPEMPTRFAKQLAQMVRGGVAIGMAREDAVLLAIRCARDSIPPLRLEILLDVAANPNSRPSDVRRRSGEPWSTTKREMEALTMLRMLRCDEESEISDDDGKLKTKTVWRYSLASNFDRETLLTMAAINPAEVWRQRDWVAEAQKPTITGNVSKVDLVINKRGKITPRGGTTHIPGDAPRSTKNPPRKGKKPPPHKAKSDNDALLRKLEKQSAAFMRRVRKKNAAVLAKVKAGRRKARRRG